MVKILVERSSFWFKGQPFVNFLVVISQHFGFKLNFSRNFGFKVKFLLTFSGFAVKILVLMSFLLKFCFFLCKTCQNFGFKGRSMFKR